MSTLPAVSFSRPLLLQLCLGTVLFTCAPGCPGGEGVDAGGTDGTGNVFVYLEHEDAELTTPCADVTACTSETLYVSVGETGNFEFRLVNDGSGPASQITAELTPSSDPAFSITNLPSASLAPDEATEFQVAFAPPLGGALQAGLLLRSDTPGRELLTLDLLGYGIGPADAILALTPAQMCDFGSVAAGASATCSVTLANEGGGNLVLSAVDYVDETAADVFSAVTLIFFPTLIAPGTDVTFTFSATPPASGAYTSTLTLETNDPAKPAATLQLLVSAP